MSLGTDYIIRYLSDISGAVKGAKQIETINSQLGKNVQEKYGQAIKSIGQIPAQFKEIPIKVDGKDAIKTIQTVGEVVQTSNGSFLQMTKTQTLVDGSLKTTTNSVKNVTDQFVKGNLEAAKGNKVFTNLADNVKQLAGRALLTIPIWIALRGAIMGFFSGISGGVKDLIEFDLALQKIRNNLQGTSEETYRAFKKIKASITEASKESGVSAIEIARAVKEFATLGFSAEESLQGALGATQLSIALFGDAGETAGAFARALNIMIDRSAGAKNAADQMNEAFALTSQLEEKNAFEIKNVTEALDKFAGTAAGVGLTMNQTLQILAALGTAGRRGSEGATLLSTAFNTLLTNLPKLSTNLGIMVSTGESTFNIFRKIIDKVTELNNTPGGQSASIAAISDVFGGARGIKIVQSLIAVKSILDENIATIPVFSALQEKAKRAMESESGQAKILGNNFTEMGKSFIRAVAGSDDMTQALIKLNSVVVNLGKGLNVIGTIIHPIFDNLGLVAGAAFIFGWQKAKIGVAIIASFAKYDALFATMGGIWAKSFEVGIMVGFRRLGGLAFAYLKTAFTTGFAGLGLAGILGKVIAGVFSAPAVIAFVGGQLLIDAFFDGWSKRINEKNSKINELSDKIVDGLKGQLSKVELTALIKKLNIELPEGKNKIAEIGALRKQLQAQMQKDLDAEALKLKPVVEIAPILSIEEANTISNELIKKQLAEQQGIAKLILQNKLDQLKAQGASEVQISKATILGTAQLKIEEDKVSLLGQQLALEKAIQDEKRLQNKLGSDSVKLFEISKTEGVAAAKAIGDVLSGETGFSDFARRGGKNLEIFKKEFADLFKQQQALQFFTGERVSGEPTLRGGSNIAIQEEALRKQEPSRTALEQAQQTSEKLAREAQIRAVVTMQTTIPINMTTTIDVSSLNELITKTASEFAKQGLVAGSEVNKMITQVLLGKQGNSL